MNIGIRLHDTAGHTLEERLACAKAQGFTCVHIAMSRVIPGFSMADAPALLTEKLADEVRTLLEKYGLTCVLLGCYLNLCSPDLESHAHTVEIYRSHLRFARRMGALLVGTETGAPNTGYETCPDCYTEESLKLLIERLTPVVRYAEEVGQTLAIEPVIRHIVSTPERCRRVLDAVNSPWLRVILDAVNLLGEQNAADAQSVIAQSVSLLGPSVALLHMKDYLSPQNPRFEEVCDTVPNSETYSGLLSTACGLGEMDYTPLLRLAREKHLPMTLENTNPLNAEAARTHLERLGSAL